MPSAVDPPTAASAAAAHPRRCWRPRCPRLLLANQLLLEHLPDAYDAHIDQRVRLVEAEQGSVGTRLPDVSVDRPIDLPAASTGRGGGATATLEPVAVPMLMLQEHRDVWIEIVHLPERRLVTAMEVFSPSNKEGIELDVAAVFAGAFQRGRYARRLRYGEPLRPWLSADDAAWVAQVVRDKGQS